MFCALNGATRYPSCANTLQNPVTTKLLPTEEPVPCNITTLPMGGALLLRFAAP